MKLFEQTLSMLGSYWWMLDPGTDSGRFSLMSLNARAVFRSPQVRSNQPLPEANTLFLFSNLVFLANNDDCIFVKDGLPFQVGYCFAQSV